MSELAKKVFELFGKPEVVAEMKLRESFSLSLRCRQCHAEARPAGGTLSQDGAGYVQFWRCLSCGAKGSTVFRLH